MFRFLPFLLIVGAAPSWAEPHWEIQYRYRQLERTLTINDFAFPSAKRGIACGFTTDRNDSDKAVVLATSNGGEQWAEIPVREACVSLKFLDDSNGWMVTDKSLWVTNESGRTWRKLTRAPSGMLRVHFVDAQHGFLAGREKRVFETFDGGETWALLPILKEVQGDPLYTTFGEISFQGKDGLISGWNIPPRRGGPAWMNPAEAAQRQLRQTPHYAVLLTTRDGGKTWMKSESSVFGQITRVSLTGTMGLGLVEFKEAFDFASEVSRVDFRTGKSERAFRQKDRAITDVRMTPDASRGYIAGYETEGSVLRSPIPGKLKILTSADLQNWTEMPVDYKAVAHSALIAAPDSNNVWVATDTGMILKLVN